MFTFYIVSAIVAGLLILISVLSGHGGGEGTLSHDFSHELAHDTGHEITPQESGHGVDHAGIWIPFFSLRFWTYFFAAFGTIGVLLEVLNLSYGFSTFWWALAGGGVAGLTVSGLFEALKEGESNTDIGTRDLLGLEATVLVGLDQDRKGKVRCMVKGEMIDVLAISERSDGLLAGEKVVIVSMENDIAHVMRAQDVLG